MLVPYMETDWNIGQKSIRVTELDLICISLRLGFNSITEFYLRWMMLVTTPQLVDRAGLMSTGYVCGT